MSKKHKKKQRQITDDLEAQPVSEATPLPKIGRPVFYMILIIYSCFTVMFRSVFEDYTDLWIIIIDFIIEGIFLAEVLSKYAVYPFIRILN